MTQGSERASLNSKTPKNRVETSGVNRRLQNKTRSDIAPLCLRPQNSRHPMMNTSARDTQNRTRLEIHGSQILSTSIKTIMAAITTRKTSVLKQISNAVTTGFPVAPWKTVMPANPRKRTGKIHSHRGSRKLRLKSAEKKSNQFSSHARSMNI